MTSRPHALSTSGLCLLVAGALAAMLFAPASPAAADCPATSLRYPSTSQSTTESTFDFTSPDGASSRGDHRAGVYSLFHPGGLAPTVITARDRFDVTGVPPGTPVDVMLWIHIDGYAYTDGCSGTGCCGQLAATLRAFPDTATVTFIGHTFQGRADFTGDVVLPISLVAGTPRDLEAEMYARRCSGGAHTVTATGHVSFVGLPTGAVIVSCKGWGTATPALRRSWGELKTIYR